MPLLDQIVLLLPHQEQTQSHGSDPVPEEVSLATFIVGIALVSPFWAGPLGHSSAFCLPPFHRPLH